MKYKKSLIFICLIICLFSFASVCASDVNETVVASEDQRDVVSVEETNDEFLSVENDDQVIESSNDGIDFLSANPAGTFTDLANEIVNATGELKLSKNYVYDATKDSNYKNGIIINKEITINGRGFIINGNNNACAFNVSESNVILKNIEFTDCYSSDNGGAIYWNGVNGSLYDCNFIKCNISNNGGVIYWNGDNGSLFDCSFVDCSCSVFSSRSTSSGVFSGSSSTSISGGVIYWNGANGKVFDCDFTNCKNFISNSHTIYLSSYTPGVMPTSSSKSNSLSYGGAIYWNGPEGSLYNCDFINCYSYSYSHSYAYSYFQDPQHTYATYSASSACTCYSYSYGVYWKGNNGNLSGCNFLNSSSSYSSDSSSDSESDSLSHNTVKASTSTTSSSYGGAIYWNGDDGHLFNCNFITSTAYSSSNSGSNSKFGGAIYWYGNNGNIFNSSFRNCHVPNKGYADSIYWYGDNGNLLNCNFINSGSNSSTSSSGYKGAVYWKGNEGNMYNCEFNGNYYDYEKYCKAEKTVYPIILVHTSKLENDNRIVMFECTQLVNNISVSVYNVTDRKVLYDEFNISSEDLTSSLNLNNLEVGEYQIVLEYYGDNFYSSTSTNDLFRICMNSSYEVIITENITEGDNVTINLTLNEDATGKVKLTLPNYVCINELENGKTSFNISDVHGGINTYEIKYIGDNKYNPIYINSAFNVLFKSNINSDMNDNYIFGDDIVLKYTITPNCTGNISIYIDNTFKANITVGEIFELENIDAGKYNITFIYNGDEHFASCSNSTILTVSKVDSSIEVNSSNLPGDVSVDVILNEKATGNITITLNDNSYSGYLIDGKTNIIIPNLNAGNYSVKINYTGDKNYNAKIYDNQLTINKLSSTIVGTVDDITYSQKTIIDVKGSVDGIAVVKIDENYIKNINIIANTIAPVTFENISAGKHNVTITLKPTNTNYDESTYNTEFTVSKKETTLQLDVEDSVYGEDVIINVTASEDGKVILKVGSITREKNVFANTLTKFNLGILAANSYNVEVSFNAGENYKPSNGNDNVIISPAKAEILTLQAENIIYGENAIIKVKTNVDGRLTIKVGSTTRVFDISANKVTSFDFGIFDANTYAVEANFDAGSNYTKALNTTQLTIDSKQTTVNVNVKDSTYGENVIVNVSASEKGKITIEVGDITKNVDVEANKRSSVDFGILNTNSYNVYVTFDGGNNYKKSYNNAFLVVSPAKSEITEIQTPNNAYGENTIIKAKTNVDGVLTATINAITKKVNVNANQLTDIDFGILDANSYEVELSFNAGNNYISTNVAKTFKVSKIDPTISVEVINATFGQTAKVIVNSNAGGNATINVGAVKTYENVLFKNNMIMQDVNDIDVGTYTVKVTYNGNNNYNSKTYNAKLTIAKASTNVVATVEDITFSQNAIVNVKGSVDGVAIVKIDNNNIKNVNIVANTIAPVTFENVPAGKHNVTITLKPSSNNYGESQYNTDFTVSKKGTTVKLATEDSVFGNDVKVNVTASEDGKVIITIGDVTKEKNVFANTLTNINLGVLGAGSYDVGISFDAGDNYKSSQCEGNIIVSPAEAQITEIQSTNNVYDDNTIIKVKTSVAGSLNVKFGSAEKTFYVDANKLTSLDLGILDAGLQNIEVTLNAGSNYTKPTRNIEVTIAPKSTAVNIEGKNSVYGENIIVNVSASETGKIAINVGDNIKYVDVEANKLTSVDLGILNVGSYTVNVTFDAGTNYVSSKGATTISIAPKNTVVSLNVKDYNADEPVIVKVTASENGKATVKIGGIVKNVDVIANKDTSVDFGVLDSRSYDVVANFTAGSNYVDSSDSASFKVLSKIDEKDINISVPEIRPNQENNIVINLPADATGTVTLIIGNSSYTFDVKNGVANVNVPKLDEGNYNYVINYSGDNKYSSFENSGHIDVEKPTPDIVVPPLDEPSADGSVTINLPQGATGTVTLVIDKKPYSFPVQNGVAKIYMPDLANGNYQYTITYSGDGKYSAFTKEGSLNVNKQSTPAKPVTKTTLTLKKVKVKKSAKKLTIQATLKVNGKSVKGKIIKFKFNKKSYKAKTNAKGVAKITVKKSVLKKLKKGKKVTYTATYGKITKKVTVKVK